jgi:anti-anti-sigma factor
MDETGFERLEDEFANLAEAGTSGVILDMSGLENLTAAALGAIIHFGQLLEKRGGKLVLTLLRPANEGLLEMLNVRDALNIAENAEAARKMISNTRQTTRKD